MRATSLHYYRAVGQRGKGALRLRELLVGVQAAAAGGGGRRAAVEEEQQEQEGEDATAASRGPSSVAAELAGLLSDLAQALDRDPQVAKRVEGEKVAQLLVVAWRSGAAVADVEPWSGGGGSSSSGKRRRPPPPLIPAHAVAPLVTELVRSGARKMPAHAPDLMAELAAAMAGLGISDGRLWAALADAARRALLREQQQQQAEEPSAAAAVQAADLAPLAAGMAAAAARAEAGAGARTVGLPAAEARAVLAALARAALRGGLVPLLPPSELAVLARAYGMVWGPRAGVAELERAGVGGGDDHDNDDDRCAVAAFVAALAEEAAAAVASAEAPGGHDLDATLFARHWDEEEEGERQEEDEGALSAAVAGSFFPGAPRTPSLSLWCATGSGWLSAVPPPRDYVDVLEVTRDAFGCVSSCSLLSSSPAGRLQQAHASLFAAAAEHVLAARPTLQPDETAALLRVCAAEAAGDDRQQPAVAVSFVERRLAARLARAMAAAAPLEDWGAREVAVAAESLARLCALRDPVAGAGVLDDDEEEEDEMEDWAAAPPPRRRPAAAAAAAGLAASARERGAFEAALRAALAAASAASGAWRPADLVAVLSAGVRGLAGGEGADRSSSAAASAPLLLLLARAAAAEAERDPRALAPSVQADLVWALSRVKGVRAAERERLLAAMAAAAAAAG
jgi:hypothetical protein